MSVIAAALKHMLAAGMPADAIVAAVAEMEAAGTPARVERKSPPASEEVWVYVMAVDHPGDALVKIGISKHPWHRLATLERQHRYNLALAHTEGPFTRQVAAAVERKAHDRLADQRETGEWFVCGQKRATEVVQLCAVEAV